ncbi:unnamed protein product [Gadus morhua 'NCC']
MQSQGSTSSQPSFDSLSSSDSLLQSDSEQAEDDESVFLAGGSPSVIMDGGGPGSGGGGGGSVRAGGSDSPGSRWTDKEEEEEEEDRGSAGGRPCAADGVAQRPKSQGDLLFAKKCAELQGFVNPLLELLTGLKRGRFERGLTGFQQSVAVDRIQRIVGVLQRPSCGEKYLSTLLQVEMMLKLWFPHVTPSSSPASSTPPPTLSFTRSIPPHKHKDQSHIPVKKRRLSWTDTESPSPSPVAVKRPCITTNDNTERKKHQVDSLPSLPLSDPTPTPEEADRDQVEQSKGKGSGNNGKPPNCSTGQSSEPSLTWVHVAPILSPSTHKSQALSTAAAAVGTAASDITNELAAVFPAPISPGSTVMQDSSVTSTTPHKHHQTDLKMPTSCQSPPAAGQQTKGTALKTCQRETLPPPVPPPTPIAALPCPLRDLMPPDFTENPHTQALLHNAEPKAAV